MKYVLDANIAIAALNGVPAVRARLEGVPGSEVGIPIVAVAELTFGAYKSRRREENLARIGALRRSITVLPLSEAVVDPVMARHAPAWREGASSRATLTLSSPVRPSIKAPSS